MDPRQLLLERNQRRRQKPGWLQSSTDPKSVKELRSFAALRAAVRSCPVHSSGWAGLFDVAERDWK